MILKAYRVNDYEIYAGHDFESAVKAAMSDWNNDRADYYEEPTEPLPDDYEIMDLDENEKPIGKVKISDYIARELKEPGMVAHDL